MTDTITTTSDEPRYCVDCGSALRPANLFGTLLCSQSSNHSYWTRIGTEPWELSEGFFIGNWIELDYTEEDDR